MDNIFTVVVALVAIASPVITTVLNHRFELKVVKIKQDDEKNRAIEAFLSEILLLGSINVLEFNGFSETALVISRYFPEKTNQELMRFIVALNRKKNEQAEHNPESNATFAGLGFEVLTHKEHPEYLGAGEFSSFYDVINHFVKESKKL